MQLGDAFVCAAGADVQGERVVRCALRLARVTGLHPLFDRLAEPASLA